MSDALSSTDLRASGFTGPDSPRDRERILERLVERSAGRVGQAYLEQVVQDLGRVLGVRYLFIGETLDGGRRARSLALAVDGEPAENFEYELAGTPCLQVTGGEACFIEDSAAELYPGDVLLQEMGVESYFGFPLCDSGGEPLGLVVALHDEPLPASGWMRTLFQLISARAGAELGRMRAESLRLRSARLSRDYLATLNHLAITSELHRGDVETFAERVVGAVKSTADFRDVSLWRRDGSADALALAVMRTDLPFEIPVGTSLPMRLDDVEERGRIRIVEAGHPELPPEIHAAMKNRGDDGYLEASIVVAGQVRGILAAVPRCPVRETAPETLRFLSDAADLLTRAEMEYQQRATEEALETARKLEALGALAGGIAHDFNNVLGAISGNAELLRLDTPADRLELVDEVLAGARHGQELVRQIFQFAEGQVMDTRPVDLAGVVQEAVRQIRPLAGSIQVRFSAAEELPRVPADPVKLAQVLMNLCRNAIQALDGRGTLELSVRRATPGDVAPHPTLLSTPCLAVEIRDDGPGIPEALRARLFEPFVTGRKGKGGTGLGLAIVDRVVQSHGGAVSVATGTGEGTTFTLLLPTRPRVGTDRADPATEPTGGPGPGSPPGNAAAGAPDGYASADDGGRQAG